jgi:uncharacterized membrane-anchored protein
MTTPPSRGEVPRGETVIASLTTRNPWTQPLPSKVPAVSTTFWSLSILASAAGSCAADLLTADLGMGVGVGMSATVAITGLVAASVLIWQLALGRCVPGCYWLAVVVVAALGTLVSTDLTDNLGLSRWVASGVLCASVVAALTGWHVGEHPATVHEVHTRRGEAWYWFVVLSACSFGTSIGDLGSGKPGPGPVRAAVVFGGVLAAIAIAYLGLGLSAVTASWAAFLVARPVGSSWGDALSGTSGVAPGRQPNLTGAVFAVAVLVMVALLALGSRRSGQSGLGQVDLPRVGP